MFFKTILFFIVVIFCATDCISQNNSEKKGRISDNVTELFHVLPDSPLVKDGIYKAFYNRKYLIAIGSFSHGKKVGNWQFFNGRGTLLQNYDYDRDSIVYEAFETRNSALRYYVDKELTDSDKTTKPYRVGGRFFGYLPFLRVFKTPFVPDYEFEPIYNAIIELLISPMGRLADYQVHLVGPGVAQSITMSTSLFSEEDKKFIPATINKQPVICRIFIACKIKPDGSLDFH